MELKICRHKYSITPEDRFMDNGSCVQLLTQSKKRSNWGHKPNPVMPKKSAKDFLGKDLKEYKSEYEDGVRILGIKKLTP